MFYEKIRNYNHLLASASDEWWTSGWSKTMIAGVEMFKTHPKITRKGWVETGEDGVIFRYVEQYEYETGVGSREGWKMIFTRNGMIFEYERETIFYTNNWFYQEHAEYDRKL